MPITLESSGDIDRTRFDRKVAIFEASEIKKLRSPAVEAETPVAELEDVEAATCTSSSSSSSSIGKNSESCGSDCEDLAGEEVESAYKGPLNVLESLEESLPIRRGISNFYSGKSKSFASLSDIAVSCPSIKDIAKQENAYTRKRRNLLASKNFCLKSSSSSLLRNNGGGISKKSSPSNGRSMLALAVAMNSINNIIPEDQEQTYQLLPPLHPSAKMMANFESPRYRSFTMRSFSVADLQGMAGKF